MFFLNIEKIPLKLTKNKYLHYPELAISCQCKKLRKRQNRAIIPLKSCAVLEDSAQLVISVNYHPLERNLR